METIQVLYQSKSMTEYQNNIHRLRHMIDLANQYSDKYYAGKPEVTDYEYDMLYKQIVALEEATGCLLSNSPTQTVGANPQDKLNKINHEHKMLSLDKCHDVAEVMSFAQKNSAVAMLKMDGLTVSATYENGKLVRLETRGNGEQGNDILFHAKSFKNLPLTINHSGRYVIDGEAIITYKDFDRINAKLKENEKYRNPRNLAAGSLNLLDPIESATRHLRFIAWDVIKGGSYNQLVQNLNESYDLGFTTVPKLVIPTEYLKNAQAIEYALDRLKELAKENDYPIDGIVIKYDDIAYGKSLGSTGHHFNNAIAYKFEDETYETTLLSIDWTMGKTGVLTPTAVFEPVEIDGTIVERASVHNISILGELKLMPGDKILVYKANMIIPQIKSNLSAEDRDAAGETSYLALPYFCPICEHPTEVSTNNETMTLLCTNPNCKGKLLGKLSNFVSKHGMDIAGLSEATLETLINKGYVTCFKDIYHLSNYKAELSKLPKMGAKSIAKLLQSIEDSRLVKMENFLASLSISLIGKSASRDISKYCNNDINQFIFIMENTSLELAAIDGIGVAATSSLDDWWHVNRNMFYELLEEVVVMVPVQSNETDVNLLKGKTFVITGSLSLYKNRDELKSKIESLGGKVSGSVSAKTSYLICNEDSNSGKSKKAKELGVKIITENEFENLLKN